MQIRTKGEQSQIAGFYYQAYKRGKITRDEGHKLTDYLDRFIRATTVHRAIGYWYDGFAGLGNSRRGDAVIFLIVGREKDEVKPLAQLSVAKKDAYWIYKCLDDYFSGIKD